MTLPHLQHVCLTVVQLGMQKGMKQHKNVTPTKKLTKNKIMQNVQALAIELVQMVMSVWPQNWHLVWKGSFSVVMMVTA